MAFRFWDDKEADLVAERLQDELKRQGYTNTVNRTTVQDSDWSNNTNHREYVRVQALKD